MSEWESLLFRFVEAFFPKLQFTVYGVPFIEWTAGTVITLSQNIIIFCPTKRTTILCHTIVLLRFTVYSLLQGVMSHES